jgi:hypothetical protein
MKNLIMITLLFCVGCSKLSGCGVDAYDYQHLTDYKGHSFYYSTECAQSEYVTVSLAQGGVDRFFYYVPEANESDVSTTAHIVTLRQLKELCPKLKDVEGLSGCSKSNSTDIFIRCDLFPGFSSYFMRAISSEIFHNYLKNITGDFDKKHTDPRWTNF